MLLKIIGLLASFVVIFIFILILITFIFAAISLSPETILLLVLLIPYGLIIKKLYPWSNETCIYLINKVSCSRVSSTDKIRKSRWSAQRVAKSFIASAIYSLVFMILVYISVHIENNKYVKTTTSNDMLLVDYFWIYMLLTLAVTLITYILLSLVHHHKKMTNCGWQRLLYLISGIVIITSIFTCYKATSHADELIVNYIIITGCFAAGYSTVMLSYFFINFLYGWVKDGFAKSSSVADTEA